MVMKRTDELDVDAVDKLFGERVDVLFRLRLFADEVQAPTGLDKVQVELHLGVRPKPVLPMLALEVEYLLQTLVVVALSLQTRKD
jgi:hypothetical protein